MKFEDAIEILLKHEGGYVNHPKDPGGETNFGIAKRSYPDLNLKTLTKEEAVEIYRRDFWEKCKIELLPPALRLIVFDCAVNQGPGVAVGLLQAAVGSKVDGVLGPETLTKLQGLNTFKVLEKYAALRLERYQRNPKFAYFGDGWTKRLLDVSLKSAQVVS
jgi:lysozyme family protein